MSDDQGIHRLYPKPEDTMTEEEYFRRTGERWEDKPRISRATHPHLWDGRKRDVWFYVWLPVVAPLVLWEACVRPKELLEDSPGFGSAVAVCIVWLFLFCVLAAFLRGVSVWQVLTIS